MFKVLAVTIWVLVVFGYLYLMQIVYQKEQSFYLFVLLALAGNLAYDGLKSLLRYRPFYSSDARSLTKYMLFGVAFLFLSVGSFFIAAALNIFLSVPITISKGVALIGYLISIAMGMNYILKAETLFKVSNSA